MNAPVIQAPVMIGQAVCEYSGRNRDICQIREAGNIQALASNLVVAFSTTVLGLLVGGIAYAIMVVRRGWYFQDFSDMEYIVESLE